MTEPKMTVDLNIPLSAEERERAARRHDIGWAVKQLWDGQRVARAGWNGRGMWLELQVPDAHSKMTLPYVFMCTTQRDLVPWLCSQTDLLATDWEMVEVSAGRAA